QRGPEPRRAGGAAGAADDGPPATPPGGRDRVGAGRRPGPLPDGGHLRPGRAPRLTGAAARACAYDGAVPIEIDPTMHPDCAPLAWMLGSWAGAGVLGYPSIESRNFGQEIDVTHDGRPILMWTSRAWILDAEGNK